MASKAERQKRALEEHKENEPDSLKSDEALKRLFEARVAVMGFKCRVLQLQGELEAQRKELRDNSSGVLARDEVERLERENVKLKSELAKARRDVQEAQHSMVQVEQLREDCRVKNEQLTRAQQQVNQLGTQVHSLQAECARLQASHTQITTHVQETQQEKDRLQRELSKTHRLAEGYKGECQSLVQDYQTAGGQIRTMEGQIRSLEEERDRYKRQVDMGLRELALRADRIKALEEQLQHVNLQAEYNYWRSNPHK